ncbi:MAG: 16S rRNA (uracil(1498)-N(3))-methyltransferase, partial [Spirochaetales bacterium]|nr:16S rRNA (uracil(1498)-N(3))-methyltransferase [Spirochaetales bacterium]
CQLQSIPRESLEYDHIRKVLRLDVGDEFRAGVINGKKGVASVREISAKEIVVELKLEAEDDQDLLPFTLLCGSARPPVTSRLLKDCTTQGVSEIFFVSSELSEKSYFSSTLWRDEKWRSLLVDGASQAATTRLPDVRRFYSVKKAVEDINAQYKFFLSLSGNSQGFGDIDVSGFEARVDRVCFAIGPERGWTESEERLFLDSGFLPLSLGTRIYRTETAVTAALNLLFLKFGYL